MADMLLEPPKFNEVSRAKCCKVELQFNFGWPLFFGPQSHLSVLAVIINTQSGNLAIRYQWVCRGR